MFVCSSHTVCRKFVDSHERSGATKVWVHNIKNQKHLSPKTIANCLRTDIVIEYKHYTLCNAGCRGLAHAWTTGIHLLSAQHQIQGCTVTSQDSSRWLNIITRNVHSVLREEKWAVLCVLLPAWEMWMSTRVFFSAMFTHGGQAQTKASCQKKHRRGRIVPSVSRVLHNMTLSSPQMIPAQMKMSPTVC